MSEVRQFGRYELIKRVGTGGMAEVHLSRQIGPQGYVKPCVLKRIVPSMVEDAEFRRMFLEEARLSALLNHPHIVQTFDFGEVEGVPYMALELVEGLNLSALCRALADKGRWIPLRAVVDIGVQILEALDYAHALRGVDGQALNVVHRDVSPQNILASLQGVVKLADFGIARHEAREQVTQGPSAKGKLGYMAPEQAMGEVIDHRADLFSLSIVLAELVSARRMLAGDAPLLVLKVPDRIRELCDKREDMPEGLVDFLVEMAAIDPEERPRSASVAADRLRQIGAAMDPRWTASTFLKTAFARYLADLPSSSWAGRPATGESLASVDPNADISAASMLPEDDAQTDVEPPNENISLGSLGLAGEDLAMPDWFVPGHKFSQHTGVDAANQLDSLRPGEPEPSPGAIELDEEALHAVRRDWYSADEQRAPEATPAVLGWTQILGEKPTAPAPRSIGRLEVPPASMPPPVLLSTSPRAESLPAPASPSPRPRGLTDPQAAQKLRKLFTPPAEGDRDDRPILPYLLGSIGVLALIAIGFFVMAAIRSAPEALPTAGTLIVTSLPEGAEVIIGGRPTGQRTPAELHDLPLRTPIELTLRMAAHVPSPRSVSVTIPETSRRTSANFRLLPSRTFVVESDPAGASVELNGQALSVRTPTKLPAIPIGETASVTISFDGHLPAFVVIESRAQTATTTTLTLEPAQIIDVEAEPSLAIIELDGREVGRAPIHGLPVPSRRRFTLRARLGGFKSEKRRLNPKQLGDRRVSFKLAPLPIFSLPLTASERRDAQRLERELAGLRVAQRRAKANLDEKQAATDRLVAQGTAPTLTDPRYDVEGAAAKLSAIEERVLEREQALSSIRFEVLGRISGED